MTQTAEMPVLASVQGPSAWSIANLLIVRGSGEIRLLGVDQRHISAPYGFDAEDDRGFPAFNRQEDAIGFRRAAALHPKHDFVAANLAMLGVSTDGQIASGAHGHLATHQHVTEVHVSAYCSLDNCGLEAVMLGRRQRGEREPFAGTSYLRSLCGVHASRQRFTMSLEQASDATHATFAWNGDI